MIDINNILNKLIVRLIPLESFELKEVRAFKRAQRNVTILCIWI